MVSRLTWVEKGNGQGFGLWALSRVCPKEKMVVNEKVCL